MAPHITIFDTVAELARQVASEIADGIENAHRDGRGYRLGCPGGRTPRPVYRALADLVASRELPLGHVTIVMMDDYAARGADGSFANVPDDVHYSCRRFGREEILGALNANATDSPIPLENLWVPDAADPGAYDERIRRAGGIDLFLLASGASDGHVAFNPPGSPEDSTTRIVTLADTTRVDNLGTFPDFSSLDEVPEFGITVGIRTIAEFSNRMVMMIAGEHKREAFDTISTASAYSPAWPATVVAIGRDARILADRAAAPSAHSTKDERD